MTSKAATSAKSSTGSTEYSNLSTPQQASPANSYPKIIYRGHNSYDTKQASDEATIAPEDYGQSLTVQAHAEDADINILMKRYGITGKMPDNADQIVQAMWGLDTTNMITDYRTAVEAARAAHEGFMQFPAELRARHDNDPQKFIDWVNNPENAEEARKFGLVKPKPEEWTPSKDTQAIIEAVKAAPGAAPGAK